MPGKKFLTNKYAEVKSKFFNNGLILLYHRVNDEKDIPDPFNLSVTKKNFNDHLEIISELGAVSRLNNFCNNLYSNQLPTNSISMSFDDGYEDNYLNAFPLLKKHNIPATIFIATEYIGKSFWWDELFRFIWKFSLVKIELKDLNISLPTSNKKEKMRAYLSVHKRIKYFSPEKRKIILSNFFRDIKEYIQYEIPKAMRNEQVKELGESGLIDIGSHSVSHSVFNNLNESRIKYELSESKAALENIIQKPVDLFAFPYGLKEDYNSRSIRELLSAGYKYSFINLASAVSAKDNRYELPRIWVKNYNKDQFRKFLSKWMN